MTFVMILIGLMDYFYAQFLPNLINIYSHKLKLYEDQDR